MKAADFRLGMRVRRRSGESSFVRDRGQGQGGVALKGRRIGIVVGLPEAISPRQRGVTIQYEGALRSEVIPIHRLEALPLKEQPIALGGTWQANENTFVR
jgi:hypothetical protein